MAAIAYTNIKLQAMSGKTGKLKKDANGYYDVILGAMNASNSQGHYYTLKGAEAIFNGSSIYYNRMLSGTLYGEQGHPKQNNLSDAMYARRILQIEETRYSTFFKSVVLDDTLWKSLPGKVEPNAVIVMGKVKPFGAFKSSTEDALSNPDVNSSYSVRSFTNDHWEGPVRVKVMSELVTWDSVGSPGMRVATKYNAPGLEDDWSAGLSYQSLVDAQAAIEKERLAGMENDSYGDLSRVLEQYESMEDSAILVPNNKVWQRWSNM